MLYWFSAFFSLLLLLLLAGFFLQPRQSFSELEKRELAKAPEFSLRSGQWSSGVEDYLQDHLPGRSHLIGLDALRRQFVGLQIADSVWRLPQGQLVEAAKNLNESRLHQNLQRVIDFAIAEILPLSALIVPAAGAISRQLTPLPYPDSRLLKLAQDQLGSSFVPLMPTLMHTEKQLYYASDPHWNGQGAYVAYQQVAPALGFEALPQSAFTIRRVDGFYGSNYARSALWDSKGDVLELWDAGLPLSVRLDEQKKDTDSLFFQHHLQGMDMYRVFLDGNHGITRILNLHSSNTKRLLVLKDSFGNSLIPLLVPHYEGIMVIDLRGWRGNLRQLLQTEKVDQLLLVYSLSRLSEDSNFAWLR